MQEIWKDVVGYEGIYQVSNMGQVKSLSRDIIHRGKASHINEKIMKPFDNCGYQCVKLSKSQKYKHYKVHRLVAMAFIPNPDNLPEINHKDENRSNNIASNLEWCDDKYNTNYGTRTQKREIPILQYALDGTLIKRYKSIHAAARELNIAPGGIGSCCSPNCGNITYKGYVWCYETEKNIEHKIYLANNPKNKRFGILQYDLNGNLIKRYNTVKEICDEFNVTRSYIHNCCKGKFKTCRGYVWKYEGV